MISVTRIFRLTMRVARWAEPHVKEWHRKRHFNRVEGQRHLDSRNWGEAEKHLTLALAERRHSNKRRCELLLNLEHAQRRQKKLTEAEQSALAAMEVAARTPGRSLRARAEDALVDVQLEQARYPEAAESIVNILNSEHAQPRPDGARVAKCYRKLGTAYLKSGHTAEAMEAFRHAAELSEQVFGVEHTETAQSFAELGMLHRQHGHHGEAQRCLRRSLDIHRVASGLDSHEASQGLYHLAGSLEESGDLDGAVGEFERLLALRARQVGVNPLDNAETEVRLAGLYVRAGRMAPAKELLNHAISVLERKGGQPLAQALEMLAFAEERSGRPEEAKRCREVASNLVSAGA
jgi:tetratricopeptide (TPR) repeat protein